MRAARHYPRLGPRALPHTNCRRPPFQASRSPPCSGRRLPPSPATYSRSALSVQHRDQLRAAPLDDARAGRVSPPDGGPTSASHLRRPTAASRCSTAPAADAAAAKPSQVRRKATPRERLRRVTDPPARWSCLPRFPRRALTSTCGRSKRRQRPSARDLASRPPRREEKPAPQVAAERSSLDRSAPTATRRRSLPCDASCP